MPPLLAAILTWGFIFWLFRRDLRERPNVTNALWIPFAWLVINMSRPIAVWLQMFGVPVSSSLEGGTPVDAVFFFGLMAAGLHVLNQRRVTLAEVFRNNIWLTLFLGYCLISIAWSDIPFIAFKRWIKVLGHPIMALIVITEPDPKEALTRLLKRLAYVLVPLSVLFIKYYPEWGRGFSEWTGAAMNRGVATDKNFLGVICAVFTFFYVWHLQQVRQMSPGKARRTEWWLGLFFLAQFFWLFRLADSKTPLAGVSVGLALMIFARLRSVNRRSVGAWFIAAVLLLIAAEMTIGIYENVLHLLGRESTLTDRTLLWADVLKVEINPIVGTGFESFWMGERLKALWAIWNFGPNQAHNGYIETYLNLGYIGVFLLFGLLVVTWRKALRALLQDRDLGGFHLGFLVIVILYNWTEASFKAVHPMWTLFYLIAMDYPQPHGRQLAEGQRSWPEHAETDPWQDRKESVLN